VVDTEGEGINAVRALGLGMVAGSPFMWLVWFADPHPTLLIHLLYPTWTVVGLVMAVGGHLLYRRRRARALARFDAAMADWEAKVPYSTGVLLARVRRNVFTNAQLIELAEHWETLRREHEEAIHAST
jgi:hypothetical protein